jgi:23S rRNA pseudouridine2604 synthase
MNRDNNRPNHRQDNRPDSRPPQRSATPRPGPRASARPAEPEGERLSKHVMQLKNCSRREAELYIEGGWVLVNGVVVEEPAFRVTRQTVTLHPDATLLGTDSVTLILHKPPGWLDGVDTDDDEDDEDDAPPPPKGRAGPGRRAPTPPPVLNCRALMSAAQHCPHDDPSIRMLKRHLSHLEVDVPLETGASGLVVFTQDWRVTRKLSEEIGSMEHELVVDVAGEVQADAMQKMARLLKDERNPLPQAKVSINSSSPERSKLRFAVKGAHPGLISYLCERAQLDLLAIKRIRIGRVVLSDLPEGQWRYLGTHERF